MEEEEKENILNNIEIFPFYLLKTISLTNFSYEINLQDILTGNIQSIFMMNYMYDIQWLINTCPLLLNQDIDVCCLHGSKGNHNQLRQDILDHKIYHWVFSEVDMGHERWGTHHTKMIILKYETGVRICILTANFLECDFNHLTQGIVVHDFPFLSDNKQFEENDSFASKEFYQPLIEYLQRVDPMSQEARSKLKRMITTLRCCDYSGVNIALVPSVPGKHLASNRKWGHLRLEYLLQRYGEIEESGENFEEITHEAVVLQVSSIGSLGVNEKYLTELKSSLLKDLPRSQLSLISTELVWPTVNCIRESTIGYISGSSIPLHSQIIEENNHIKQGFSSILRQWIGELPGRKRFPPHMKCYFRYKVKEKLNYIENTSSVNKNNLSSISDSSINNHPLNKKSKINEVQKIFELSWFLLTSANLSQAAWGVSQKNGQQLYIKSYEMGVFFHPSISRNTHSRSFSCTPLHSKLGLKNELIYSENCKFQSLNLSSKINLSDIQSKIYFPIPFSLSPPPYSTDEKPWIVDKTYPDPDLWGNTWPPR